MERNWIEYSIDTNAQSICKRCSSCWLLSRAKQFSSFSFIYFVLQRRKLFLITLTPGNACQSQIHNLFKLCSIKKEKKQKKTNIHNSWHERRHLSFFQSCGWWQCCCYCFVKILLLANSKDIHHQFRHCCIKTQASKLSSILEWHSCNRRGMGMRVNRFPLTHQQHNYRQKVTQDVETWTFNLFCCVVPLSSLMLLASLLLLLLHHCFPCKKQAIRKMLWVGNMIFLARFLLKLVL